MRTLKNVWTGRIPKGNGTSQKSSFFRGHLTQNWVHMSHIGLFLRDRKGSPGGSSFKQTCTKQRLAYQRVTLEVAEAIVVCGIWVGIEQQRRVELQIIKRSARKRSNLVPKNFLISFISNLQGDAFDGPLMIRRGWSVDKVEGEGVGADVVSGHSPRFEPPVRRPVRPVTCRCKKMQG